MRANGEVPVAIDVGVLTTKEREDPGDHLGVVEVSVGEQSHEASVDERGEEHEPHDLVGHFRPRVVVDVADGDNDEVPDDDVKDSDES